MPEHGPGGEPHEPKPKDMTTSNAMMEELEAVGEAFIDPRSSDLDKYAATYTNQFGDEVMIMGRVVGSVKAYSASISDKEGKEKAWVGTDSKEGGQYHWEVAELSDLEEASTEDVEKLVQLVQPAEQQED